MPGVLSTPELPNFIKLLGDSFPNTSWYRYLHLWENLIFSLIVAGFISILAFLASRKRDLIPGRLQNAVEFFVGSLDEFISGILGDNTARYTPFIGTLFIYILFMNLAGLVPFMKSATSSLSTTVALALCVFIYVQYSAFKELGLLGYFDHLLGRPRGFLAFSAVFPLLMFFMHVITELVRPVSLALRLRSNIWGDDTLLAVVAGFGMKGVPLLLFSMLLAIIASVVQAMVFCLLTTIYLALIIEPEGKKEKEE